VTRRSVLHLDSGSSFRGGQRQLLLLATAQQHDPDGPLPQILACDSRLLAAALREGIAAHRWSGPLHPRGLLQIRAALQQDPELLLHVHDSRALGAVRLIAGKAAQQRLVVHRRIDDPPRNRASTHWKYRRGQVICVSNAVAGVLECFGIPAERLHVVHSALPSRAIVPGSTGAGDEEGPLRLLAIGALVPHKGHQVLLEAIAAARTPTLLRIIGCGPLHSKLVQLSHALGIAERVEFLGDDVAIPDELRDCDVLVHPSLSEGLGTAVLDAMWSARPVVASAVGGLPELVEEGRTGWLLPPRDPMALAACLDEIGAPRSDARDELRARGAAGRERARTCFALAEMVRSTRDVYDVCP